MILQLTIICMSGGVVVISEDMPSLDLNKDGKWFTKFVRFTKKNTSNEPISVWPT